MVQAHKPPEEKEDKREAERLDAVAKGDEARSKEVESKVVAACNACGEDEAKISMGAGPVSGYSLPIWGPVIMQLLKDFGLQLAANSLPVLRAKIELWQPTNGMMKVVRKQLLAAIDHLSNQLPLQEGNLEEFSFTQPPLTR